MLGRDLTKKYKLAIVDLMKNASKDSFDYFSPQGDLSSFNTVEVLKRNEGKLRKLEKDDDVKGQIAE